MLLSPPPPSSLPPVTSISECGEKGEGVHDNELGLEDTAMPKRGSGGGRDEALLCDADISALAQFTGAQINAKTSRKLAQYKRIGYFYIASVDAIFAEGKESQDPIVNKTSNVALRENCSFFLTGKKVLAFNFPPPKRTN